MFRSITLPWESSLILERSPGVHLVAYVVLGEVNLSSSQVQLEWKTLESWTVAHWVGLVSHTAVAKQGTGVGMQTPCMNGESMLKLESWKINFLNSSTPRNHPLTMDLLGVPPGSTGPRFQLAGLLPLCPAPPPSGVRLGEAGALRCALEGLRAREEADATCGGSGARRGGGHRGVARDGGLMLMLMFLVHLLIFMVLITGINSQFKK